MSDIITYLNSAAVGLFGSVLSAAFCGALNSPRNRHVFWTSMVVLPLLQVGGILLWGMEIQRQIYPLLVHLPLILLLWFLTEKLLWSTISVLTAYLCCQLRRWLALLVVAVFSGGATMQAVTELAVTLPLLLLLVRFAAPAVRRLMEHPAKLQCQFGVVSALYYVFDYATVVYTDLLTSGKPVVVEFMPFVCCAAYIAFLLYNSAGEDKYSRLRQIQKSLDLQIKQSVREIKSLRESQELARRYRHDLRHHLQYVSACIENGQTEQAQSYISGICREIESQKVVRYCENEAANLILSSFDARAKKEGVELTIQGSLPEFILLPDSDLCVILSNALENALHACHEPAAKGQPCTIDVQFYERDSKLFLQITNPCTQPVRFEKGIPVSEQPGHGVGVQSICAIVQKYGGVCTFLVKEERFILRLSL